MTSTLRYPDGLSEGHAARRAWRTRAATLASLVVLGALMALAMTGLLAGGRSPPRVADAPAARLTVTAPATLRNGEFFEMRVEIEARADIADASIAIPPALWRDMTINTMIPAAGEESYKDGAFRLAYGPLKAGERLALKIDGQINPPLTLGTRGEIALLDGDRRLAAVPLSIRVLP